MLGFGRTYITTLIPQNTKFIAISFRKTFNVVSVPDSYLVVAFALVDDGAVFYLNGIEGSRRCVHNAHTQCTHTMHTHNARTQSTHTTHAHNARTQRTHTKIASFRRHCCTIGHCVHVLRLLSFLHVHTTTPLHPVSHLFSCVAGVLSVP